MGHHIDAEGRFQSDKYPDLPPDKIILSFHDPAAQRGLSRFAAMTSDRRLAKDIWDRLQAITGHAIPFGALRYEEDEMPPPRSEGINE